MTMATKENNGFCFVFTPFAAYFIHTGTWKTSRGFINLESRYCKPRQYGKVKHRSVGLQAACIIISNVFLGDSELYSGQDCIVVGKTV